MTGVANLRQTKKCAAGAKDQEADKSTETRHPESKAERKERLSNKRAGEVDRLNKRDSEGAPDDKSSSSRQ